MSRALELIARRFGSIPLPEGDLKGTYTAFTLTGTYGMDHLQALEEAGLSHVHLLPVFDIATVNEDRSQWQTPDPAVLETYPPDSEQQQAAVTAAADLDAVLAEAEGINDVTRSLVYSAEIVAAVAVVPSLVYLAVQVRQGNTRSRATAPSTMSSSWSKATTSFSPAISLASRFDTKLLPKTICHRSQGRLHVLVGEGGALHHTRCHPSVHGDKVLCPWRCAKSRVNYY